MGEEKDENDRRTMPEGILEPGRLTTTADPEMRERAERIIREHEEQNEDDEAAGA